MFENMLITFREALEAVLVVGIVLGYLRQSGRGHLRSAVWAGVAAGIGGSIAGKFIFDWVAGGFTGQAEEVVEGVTMLVGAGLLATLIVWMARQRNIADTVRRRVDRSADSGGWLGIFLLVLVAIIREGIETVIFLQATGAASEGANGGMIGAILGLVLALVMGVLMFAWAVRLPLRTFLNVSAVLLIFFAAGLVAHGIHELQEAHVIPIVAEHVFDINPAVNADGSYPILHEKGAVGGILKGLFGYNGNPNLIELIAYIVALSTSLLAWTLSRRAAQQPEPQANPGCCPTS
jgi:high-affinity iron transporter